MEDCALQLYKHNGAQYEYSSYLDLETTLAEQSEELDGFSDKYVHLSEQLPALAGVDLLSFYSLFSYLIWCLVIDNIYFIYFILFILLFQCFFHCCH